MLSGNEAWVDLKAALLDREIVVAAPEADTAHLDHAQPPTLGAVVDGELLQQHDPMRDRVQLQVVLLRGEIVEQDDGAPPTGEEVLQREHLPAIAQRALRQEPQLGQAVEYDPGRVDLA